MKNKFLLKKELTEKRGCAGDQVPAEENDKVKIYDLGFRDVSIDKFRYSLLDIQMENISQSIKDDTLRSAIINPTKLKEHIECEREMLLNDLALLENTDLKSQ